LQKVGQKYLDKDKKWKKCQYNMFEYDEDGWADASRFLPLDFDLCNVKVKDKPKTYSGWHTANYWDGLNIKKDDVILYWKKVLE
jgi:hypothetical protein